MVEGSTGLHRSLAAALRFAPRLQRPEAVLVGKDGNAVVGTVISSAPSPTRGLVTSPCTGGNISRYFADADDGERHVQDDEGLEYAGLQKARDAAVRTLSEVACDVVLNGGRQALVATVRGVGGRVRLKVMLSLRTEWPAAGSQGVVTSGGTPHHLAVSA